MTDNVVELRTPQGRENLDQLLESVTIRCPEDIHDAALTLARIAEERGMQALICDDISSKEPMLDSDGSILAADIFGWTADGERWWENGRLALSSPIPRACRYESEAFWINKHSFHTRWHNHYLDEIDLSEFQKTINCGAAIVIPVHLPFGQISSNSFISFDRAKEDLAEEFAVFGALLSHVTRRFVASYVQTQRTKHRIPSDCALSKREVQCLRWAAIGKTDREISMIMERSHATIRYHIHRAGEKLDSVNRAQTIFKAGQLGYLGASD